MEHHISIMYNNDKTLFSVYWLIQVLLLNRGICISSGVAVGLGVGLIIRIKISQCQWSCVDILSIHWLATSEKE